MSGHDPRLDMGREALIAQLDERDAAEARQDAKVLRGGPAVLPDCMMPDGADPCAGYTRLREVIEGQGLSMQAMSAKISELAIKLNEARAEIGQLRQEPRDVTSISMMSAGGYR